MHGISDSRIAGVYARENTVGTEGLYKTAERGYKGQNSWAQARHDHEPAGSNSGRVAGSLASHGDGVVAPAS
jgi:hypothetical protein